MKNLIFLIAAYLLCFAGTCDIEPADPAPDPNQPHQNANIKVFWDWADGQFIKTEQEVKIQMEAPDTKWAMHIDFFGQPGGGYLALRTQTGSQIGMAEFTVFGADNCQEGATGSACKYISSPDQGYSIEIPFPMSPGHRYQFRVTRLEADGNGRWWGAWVTDMDTGLESYLGKLRKPNANTLAKNTYNYVEYTGGSMPCDQVPGSNAYFFPPKATGHDSSGTNFTGTYSNYSLGSCVTGQVTVTTVDGVDGVPMVFHGN